MKRFQCDCGTQVFFENHRCVNCESRLGFDPETMEMLALTSAGEGLYVEEAGNQFKFCDNGVSFDACNWLIAADDTDHRLCFACQFNRIIPNQSLPENDHRWRRLEEGKKRLFFTLMRLELPLTNGWEDPDNGLLMDFIDDGRGQPSYGDSFVSTGHLNGVITINPLEADDVARTAARLELNQRYRTVLGHMRHESGHYYWNRLDPDEDTRADFARQFGDESRDYAEALKEYYRDGPPPQWRSQFISAYASAHPTEDWAESWGHYLHIYDAMETAAAQQLIEEWPSEMPVTKRIHIWRGLSITLNELNRSVGRGDAYPFVINDLVAEKLEFVDRIIARLRVRAEQETPSQGPP